MSFKQKAKACAHLQSAIKILRFGMDPEKSEKNAEHEAHGAHTVAGIVYFAEITKLSGWGPNKVYCIGERHGDQKADVDYITEYKRLLKANDESENPVPIDFFIEDDNFPKDALIINKHLSETDLPKNSWNKRLQHHLRGCYENRDDIEYITGVADLTKFSDQLSKCPYKHTRVHWADPKCFNAMWSESCRDIIYGLSYQKNPEWLMEAQKVPQFTSSTSFKRFQEDFPNVTAHIKGESNLYDLVESNPYIQDQLRRSMYHGSLFRVWFDNVISKEKKIWMDKRMENRENDFWWRLGIFVARRRAMDLYAFLRMTRGPMSARGRFNNVIVHAGSAHTKAIVSLFRFVESDYARFSIIERDEDITDSATGAMQLEFCSKAKMQIDLCKAISFERGVRKKGIKRPSFPSASLHAVSEKKRRKIIYDSD